MKLCTIVTPAGAQFGAAVDRGILDLEEAARRFPDASMAVRQLLPTGGFATALAFLEAGEPAMEAAHALTARAADAPAACFHDADQVHWCAPVPGARKLLALAGNYGEHIREGGGEVPEAQTTYPYFFMKPPSTALIGHGEPYLISAGQHRVDWEGELAVIIGRCARHVPAESALDYVAGYACFNDISDRALAVNPQRVARPRDSFFDWLVGKWFDRAGPCGPYLVTRDEVPDVASLAIRVRVNGVQKQDGSTGQMIFGIPELLEFITRVVTLEPGDIIATGTPASVGSARGEYLKPGDTVEVEIDRIGLLRTPISE